MDSNTHSTSQSAGTPAGFPALVAELQSLADQDPDRLADGAWAERVLVLRGLADRLEGHWLAELAGLDARGAAGAEQGVQAGSTAAWLRRRLRMSAGTASSLVRTARALYRGPLTGPARPWPMGSLSVAHAQVLAAGTQDLPDHATAEAEPVLLEAARRLDPPRLRRAVAHLRLVADPDGADAQAERRQQQRGLWLSPTWEGMVAVNGLLEPEAGQTLVAALEPLARPPTPTTPAPVASAGPTPWPSWPAAAWKPAGSPRPVGCGPSCGDGGPGQPPRPPRWRGWGGRWALAAGPRDLPAAGLRRRRHPGPGHPPPDPPPPGPRRRWAAWPPSSRQRRPGSPRPLAAPPPSRWRSAAPAGSSPPPNGPPWRSATAAARFPGCDRPPAWCEAHHLRHWLHGGPTDLANLALVCRAHHRAVHEGGWQLTRDPDGRLTATPPHRKHRAAA